MKVNELLSSITRLLKFHDKVGVFDIKDIDISIDADYNEVYINAVEENKGNDY